MDYGMYCGYEHDMLTQFQQKMDDLQEKLDEYMVHDLARKADSLVRRFDQFMENQRMTSEMNRPNISHQVPIAPQRQFPQRAGRFSTCKNCGGVGHVDLECQVGMSFFQDPDPQISYEANYFNQSCDNQFHDPYNVGWNSHQDFSLWNDERTKSQKNFESNFNCQYVYINSQSPSQKSNLELMLEKFVNDSEKQSEQLSTQMEGLDSLFDKSQSPIDNNMKKQDLELSSNDIDCEHDRPFIQTQIFVETNVNVEEKDEFVFVGEDEESSMEEIESSSMNIKHLYPTSESNGFMVMNVDEQATEHDRVLEASTYLQPHQEVDSNIESAQIFSLKSDAPNHVSYKPFKVHPTIEGRLLLMKGIVKHILTTPCQNFWENYDAVAGHKVKIKSTTTTLRDRRPLVRNLAHGVHRSTVARLSRPLRSSTASTARAPTIPFPSVLRCRPFSRAHRLSPFTSHPRISL